MIRRTVLILLGIFLAAPWTDAAEERPPEVVRIGVGFAGRYKVGHWTPVRITLRGGSRPATGRVSLTVPDGDGVPSRVVTAADEPCRLTPGRETTVLLYARFGRIRSEATVRFRVDGEVIAQKTFRTGTEADDDHFPPAILASKQLIVVVGPSLLGVDEAVLLARHGPDVRAEVVRLEDVEQLPTRWYGYEGVDAVVLSTSRPEIYRTLKSGGRVEALDTWIRTGGRLVLCVGAAAEEILSEQAPLRRFAPGRFDKMVRLRQTAGLESLAGGSTPVGHGRISLRVPQLRDIQGTIELWEGKLPLVIRAPRSFGRVTFVGIDLDREPFETWKDRGRLAAELLALPTRPVDDVAESSAIMHYGFADVAGQLRSALDRFPGVRLVPFGIVVGLIVLYIFLIGPGDFLLLRKIRRMRWTWLTFPLIVVLFGTGAYVAAYRLKGNRVRVNQVDLIDVDAAGGFVRGTSWVNLFSPSTDTYNLSFQPGLPDGRTPQGAEVLVAWLGLPGDGLGGMNPKTAGPSMGDRAYGFAPGLDAVHDVPVPVWSTKSFTSRWIAKVAATDVAVEADLTLEEELPRGTITNTLDFPLEECILVYDRWAYKLGTLEPGQSVTIGEAGRRSELKTLLTGRKMVMDEKTETIRQHATPYDPASVDIPYILRTMMFFEAAGGRRYTSLLNRYQPFVDLSGLLDTDRAILVAHGPSAGGGTKHGGQFLRDGRPLAGPGDTHATFYRFVFPVRTKLPGEAASGR
jgi:hypothetical protein